MHGINGITDLGNLNDVVSALPLRRSDLGIALNHRNHIAANSVGNLDKHQSDWPTTDHGDSIANLHSRLMQATQYASQRFDHGSILIADGVGNAEHVALDDPAGHANVLGIGAVIEQQVFAKVLLMLGAVEAAPARCRIQSNDPGAFLKILDSRSNLFDDSGQFVSK